MRVFTFYGRATPVTRERDLERDPTKPVARPKRAPNAATPLTPLTQLNPLNPLFAL